MKHTQDELPPFNRELQTSLLKIQRLIIILLELLNNAFRTQISVYVSTIYTHFNGINSYGEFQKPH